jgi:probable O-glycosylation ligase (exosortase A-associated)
VLTDVLALCLIALFIWKGATRPFIALAGVLWVDLYQPQLLSQSFLAEKPLSLLMNGFFFLSAGLNFSKLYRPSSWFYIVIIPAFVAWITLTTYNAQFPGAAWPRYDVAVKMLLFCYFIPYVLGSRKEFELFLWILISSMIYFIVAAGAKSILSGGGYGLDLVSNTSGVLWSEGSTLATQAICILPLLLYAGRDSLLGVERRFLRIILLGAAFAALMVLIGTAARTGLIALGALVVLSVLHSRSKLKAIAVIALLPIVSFPFITSDWTARMDTMSNIDEESSALGRIVVWRWTLDYAKEHPLMGGGFEAYLANAGQLAGYSRPGEVVINPSTGKAFHNIFIQVLGEHGYVGLALYVAMIIHLLRTSRRLAKRATESWRRSLGMCVFISTTVYCVGGMFIGVAFYPWLFYMYGFTIALRQAADLTFSGEPREPLPGLEHERLLAGAAATGL